MFLLSRRHLRWLSILFILIFSIRLLSKSFQEQGNHDGNLKFEQLQDQSPGVGVARDYNDDSQASNGQPTRKDSLTNTIDFKPSRHFHQHQHHRHHKRTVTAQVWNEYVCKGEKLLALMAMSVEDATKDLSFPSESTFTSYDDLDGNGWSLYDRSKNFNFAHLNVEKVFDDLGFDGTSGGPLDLGVKNRIASWSQDEKYVVDGKEHNPSNAQYINTFNPTQGLIGAWSNYGPAYHLRNEANAVLPNLRQWSDVAFLEWKNQLVLSGLARWGDVEIRAPRMVLRINMMNGVTLDLLDQILRNLPASGRPKGPSAWGVPTPRWSDRKTFTMDSDAGKVLLGSPNGRGVVWFLLQHKRAFGSKIIESVVVFKEGGGVFMGFVFGDVS